MNKRAKVKSSRVRPLSSPPLRRRVGAHRAESGLSKRAVVEAAAAQHVRGNRHVNPVLLYLDRLEASMKRTRRAVQLLSRAFASFVIASAPNVLKDEAGALATAERRYKEFIDQVGEKFVNGPRFLDEVRAAARAASARRESSLASGEGDGAGSSTPDPDKLT
jgi:hypothetical protein